MDYDTIIIGGGLSGLAAGWHRQQRGERVLVLDRNAHPGGVVATLGKDGYLVESGPNTLMVNDRRVMELIDAVGLSERVVEAAPDASKRFLVKEGDVIAAPMSPVEFWKTPLFSGAAKRSLLAEPFRRKYASDEEESLASFVRRRLGEEFLDQAIQPIVSGVYAGDPERLSVKHAMPALYQMEQESGSLIRGGISKMFRKSPYRIKRKLISFRQGLGELPQALADTLGAAFVANTEIKEISKSSAGWEVDFNGRRYETKNLVITIPAFSLSGLPLPDALQESLQKFESMPYAPVTVVALGFDRSQVEHALDGFGMLIPEREGQPVLGSLFSSTLFSGRAPAGKVLLTSFVGGRLHPERAAQKDSEIEAEVMSTLRKLLGIQGDPGFRHIVRWGRAIPQMELGHGDFIDCIAKIEAGWEGLVLSGNYRHGISAPQCLLANA